VLLPPSGTRAGETFPQLASVEQSQAVMVAVNAAGAVVAQQQAPERIGKGLARHPIPLMVLARLAVAVDHQAQGLGAALLKDAIGRTLAAADIAGIHTLAVHATNERARGFYEHFGFRPSPSDPLHLFVLLKDLQSMSLLS
jgi:GNAT superfamily N-acetyltransferase